MKNALLIGLAVGLASGAATHGALAVVRDRSDKVFYGVWVAGVLVRLSVLVGAFVYVVAYTELALGAAMIGILAGQTAVQLVPIRSRYVPPRDGDRRSGGARRPRRGGDRAAMMASAA